jgi:hypothetical protein
VGLSGCSVGGGDEPVKPAKGPAKDVAVLVHSLETATRAGDWKSVCDRLFSRDARKRAAGRDCPKLLRSQAGKPAGARIELLSLRIKRRDIEAKVRTRARGQNAIDETLRVVRDRGDFRIDSLD